MIHSKQWHYSLQQDFQKLHSTRRNPRDSSNSTFYLGSHTEDKELFIQSRKDILHAEGKEIFKYIHSYYKTFQRHSRHSSRKTFQRHSSNPDIPVIHDIQPFQTILRASRDSSQFRKFYNLQHSPIRMHILHILHIGWFPQKLHRVPVETLQTTNFHSSKQGRCCIISRNGHALQNRILASFRLVIKSC